MTYTHNQHAARPVYEPVTLVFPDDARLKYPSYEAAMQHLRLKRGICECDTIATVDATRMNYGCYLWHAPPTGGPMRLVCMCVTADNEELTFLP